MENHGQWTGIDIDQEFATVELHALAVQASDEFIQLFSFALISPAIKQ
jgi:hypothetical protein